MDRVKQGMFLRYVHVAVIFLFMSGFQYLPPIGGITPYGMKILGVFIGVVYGWSTMDMIWPSLLGLCALSLYTGKGAIAVFQMGFGDRITLVLFFLLLFGELINKVGLSKWIADWCISRKCVQGKPYAILAMFCLAGSIISAFVHCFAGIIIIWGIFLSFCKEVGIKPGHPYACVSLVALAYIPMMAGNILPFMGSSILVNSLQSQLTGIDMPYVSFTLMELLLTILGAVLYFAVVRFVIRPDTAIVEQYRPAEKDLSLNREQKVVACLLLVMLVTLFLQGLLPKGLAVTAFLKTMDIAGVVALILVIYYVISQKQNNGIPFGELAKGMNWNLVLMFAMITPLTASISAPETGIMEYLNDLLLNVLGGMNPHLFVVMVLLLASVITQFCNNVAVVLLCVPIMYSLAGSIGANVLVISILAAFNLNIAFCTPAASGPAAMIFSNQEWVGTKASYLHGMIIFVINMLVTTGGMFLAELFV